MDLSFLGPAGASVIIVWFFLKYMRDEADNRDATYKVLADAINKNSEHIATSSESQRDVVKSNQEILTFMKSLNGSLKGVVKEKQEKAKGSS